MNKETIFFGVIGLFILVLITIYYFRRCNHCWHSVKYKCFTDNKNEQHRKCCLCGTVAYRFMTTVASKNHGRYAPDAPKKWSEWREPSYD